MVSVEACGANGADKERKKLEKGKKIQKVLKERTVDDLLEDLEVQLPSLLEHIRDFKIQRRDDDKNVA